MSLDPNIATDVQKASPGEYVILFELDTSVIISGGGIYYFTQARYESAAISFNSEVYWPLDCEASGFEMTTKGQLPQPSLKLGLVGSSTIPQTVRALIRQHGDLIGAQVIRRRTFRKYLDGEAGADPQAQFAPDIYRIEQKAYQDNIYIEWKLSAYNDFEGKKIPARQITRDLCMPQTYRVWVSGTTFDYTKATCPYTGTNYFDADGVVATAQYDKCGKRLSDCKLRFPNLSLPFRGFPGVSRIRL